MKNSTTTIENLESRVLLSAVPAVLSVTIKEDQLAVKVALLKFRYDAAVGDLKLLTDRQAIKKALAKGDTSLKAPFAQLKTDAAKISSTLSQERLSESAAALKDQSAIKLEEIQILKDKGDATALAADRVKLKADRVQLQTDLLAGIDARVATRTSALATLTTDTNAIVTAADTDPKTTVALTSAVAIFSADRVTAFNSLTSDLSAIGAARTTLASDLTAAENT